MAGILSRPQCVKLVLSEYSHLSTRRIAESIEMATFLSMRKCAEWYAYK